MANQTPSPIAETNGHTANGTNGTTKPQNRAAWIPAKKVIPFKVSSAPYTSPGPGQVVIKNTAVAINPFDWVLQFIGPALAGYLKYPFILGTDVAGEVVEIGPGVTRFAVGDRVCGSSTAIAKEVNNPAEGGDEQASVLGLGLGTAAFGLFHKEYLAFDMPKRSEKGRPEVQLGKSGQPRVVIITGGASSVGANAIQLAAAAGYEVLSMSSPKNFEYVNSLGANHVFDYRSKSLPRDLISAVKSKELVGAYTIGAGAVEACTLVLKKHDPSLTRQFIAVTGQHIPSEKLTPFVGKGTFFIGMIGGMVKSSFRQRRTGVTAKFILVDGLVDSDSVASHIRMDFLPEALARGQFVPALPPLVVGKGLEKIQEALDVQRKGVSGRKLVVTL
ncbi:hypothetical protein BDW74DRAFT_188339 [Aspergillus multicolor]|uniref:zinc-binding alcohol dehydrogenase family protein n=1 Tax=Aspergillus multicolor TaxID=41759 RepID=UPI003CCDCC2F